MSEYTGKETFQFLLSGREAAGVANDWYERQVASDLRLRRAKTKGHVVVETRDIMFARHIQTWYPNCKLNIKKGE